jgi:hypothetical protein
MQRFLRLFGMFLAFAFSVGPVWSIEPFSLEDAAAKASTALPQRLVDHLDPNGSLVITYSNGLKMPICEIFWARAVLVEDRSSLSGKLTYQDLKPGSLIGVIHFLPEASEDFREDFHDQKLSPGYYTMRYDITSDADAHDLVLLSPVRVDGDAERILASDQLRRLSRMASRTQQPAVMSLVTTEVSDNDSPSVRMDDEGTCILQVNLHAASHSGPAKKLALAILVAKPIPDNDGS